MYRLSVPAPSQKTPLFPKPKDTVVADEEEKREEKKEEKKDIETKSVDDIVESVDSIEIEDSEESEDTECKDECNEEVVIDYKEEEDDGSVPIIFRGFIQGDMFSVPTCYTLRILVDKSGRASPNISQIYSDIKNVLESYGQLNAHLYSAEANVIINTPYSPKNENTVTTPIFIKNLLTRHGMLRRIQYISISIDMEKFDRNHPYLLYISSKLKWSQYNIVMQNSGDEGIDLRGKVLNMNIPIEYVSFDMPLNYMYIYIPGIHSSMKKLKVGETYRESN